MNPPRPPLKDERREERMRRSAKRARDGSVDVTAGSSLPPAATRPCSKCLHTGEGDHACGSFV